MKLFPLFILWLWAAPVFADKLEAREHNDRYSGHYGYSRVPQHQDRQDPTEQILEVLLNQGISGVGLIFLSWFIWKTNGQARADRRELEGRLLDVIKESNKTLVEHGVELQNISRELERIRS
jgi:hypothetical protein